MLPTSDRLWQAIEAKDPRFDGWVFIGVTSTGIYCRPSCAARTPKRANMRLFTTAAAAQASGFRACKRCRPDASPGSPEWNRRADLVGRAMRLIADGLVDREGVAGLAARLGYCSRHVHRELVGELGVGPLALARAQRAQTARILLETTRLPVAEVAMAAGFGSVRQFNDTIRAVFATAPMALRVGAGRSGQVVSGNGSNGHGANGRAVVLRLAYRAPIEATALIEFFGARAVPAVEDVVDGAYRRSVRLPHGFGVIELTPRDGYVQATVSCGDLRDLATAVGRSRAVLDLDSDPDAVVDVLGGDPVIGGLVRSAPGRRVPGHVDPHELAVRAVLGQQVSVRGAVTHAARLVAAYGEELPEPVGSVTRLFPSAAALAQADPERLAMPASRRRALIGLAEALASGALSLDPGVDRREARAQLLGIPGIGPWTADYIAMRALRDPDAFLASDLGIRRGLEALGHDGSARSAVALAEAWRPYRAYAAQHLWARDAT